MIQFVRRSPIALPILALLTILVTSDLSADEKLTVTWRHGRLGIVANEVPLTVVLDEISKQTGLKVTGKADPAVRVTVRFPILPLEKALQRVMGKVGYTITYGGPKGAPSAIALLAKGQEGPRELPPDATKVPRPPQHQPGTDTTETLEVGPPPKERPPQPPSTRQFTAAPVNAFERVSALKAKEKDMSPQEISKQIEAIEGQDQLWHDPAAEPSEETAKAMEQAKAEEAKAAEQDQRGKDYDAQLQKLLPSLQGLTPDQAEARIAALKSSVLGK